MSALHSTIELMIQIPHLPSLFQQIKNSIGFKFQNGFNSCDWASFQLINMKSLKTFVRRPTKVTSSQPWRSKSCFLTSM